MGEGDIAGDDSSDNFQIAEDVREADGLQHFRFPILLISSPTGEWHRLVDDPDEADETEMQGHDHERSWLAALLIVSASLHRDRLCLAGASVFRGTCGRKAQSLRKLLWGSGVSCA